MNDAVAQKIEIFCANHGVAGPLDIAPIKAGRNSAVFLATSPAGRWIVKNYFRHPSDKRDRLGNEYHFLQLLVQAGTANVAHPVGCDSEQGLAVYSYLPGVRPHVLDSRHINGAIDFIVSINRDVVRSAALHAATASDACFSIRGHLNLAQTRLSRLENILAETGIEAAARQFVLNELLPCWRALQAVLKASPLSFETTLDRSLQILSPSDFGFHNALESGGNLFFIDFEYAGWDDPAKLICDFICQPEVAISDELGEQFLSGLCARLPAGDVVAERAKTLLPFHRLKWCCILLNEFLPDARLRREHAGINSAGLLEQQLDKAQQYFKQYLIIET